MVAATGIEAEKALADARRAELLNEVSHSGLLRELSTLQKFNTTSLANVVGGLFSDQNQGTKEALIRSAVAVAEARGEDSGLGFAGKNRDSALFGAYLKLGSIPDKDVAQAEVYLRGVLEERKARSNEKSSTHFRDMVKSSPKGREHE